MGQSAGLQNQKLQVRALPFSQDDLMRGDVTGEHTGLICPSCGFESRLRDYFWE